MQDKVGEGSKILAVLIDADNVSAAVVEAMLAKISSLGYACVKRMYGDWTTPNLGGWKKVMLEHALQPIQQFAYTTGKNSTDGSMMIDAMDLMYTQRFDGFCICSSDSDFTRLALRLREQGLLVYGFGEHKTPTSFVSACTDFTYIEAFRPEPAPMEMQGNQVVQEVMAHNSVDPRRLIHDAIESIKDSTGWCSGALLGGTVKSKDFGVKTLTRLIQQYPKNFELQLRATRDSVGTMMFVRNKKPIKNVNVQSVLH